MHTSYKISASCYTAWS